MPRLELIRLFKDKCFRLHELKFARERAHIPLDEDLFREIRYWERILVRVKELRGADLIVTEDRE